MAYRRLLALTTPRLTRYIPHQPTPKQSAALLCDQREVFYGGAAGGGKSDWLLMAALQYADVPGYAALLLRRRYTDLALPGALMDRAAEWLRPTDAHWSHETKTWTFPSGATLTLGYLDHDGDQYRYQGSAYQMVGFDELTQFPEAHYRYLFSRLRRLAGAAVPLRMRAASNPGGLGHEWVRQRMLIEGREHGRVFIPARLADNPHLDREEYTASLAELDPVTRQQLLDGDWSARARGSTFRREWFEIVDTPPADLSCVRYWDLAATEARPGADPDWTAGCRIGRTGEGVFYVTDMRRMRGTPQAVEALVRQTAQLDGVATRVYMEQEPGASSVSLIDYYRRRVLDGMAFYGVRQTGSKEVRAAPLSSQAQAGNVRLVRGPWVGAFLDELDAFPAGGHDDQVDAAAGGFAQIAQRRTLRAV